MRGAEARCQPAADATYEHAAENGRIREAFDRRARDAVQSASETR
jgi:hypothetical protein